MKTDHSNPCVLCYLPRPSFQPAVPAFKNFTSFATHYPRVFYTDSNEWPEGAAIRLKGSIDKAAANSRYPTGAENKWAANNLCFWSGMRVASSLGYTHALYLEVDCRVYGDGWDKKVYDEFFAAGPGNVLAGTMLTYNASNKDFEHAKAFNEFVQANTGKRWPICSYGGGGCDEKFEPVLMANGALGIYDLRWIAKRFDLGNTVQLARSTTAWDLAIGRELVRDFGINAFKKAVHLDSVYSLFKDRLLNEQQRIDLLLKGDVVAVHQVKSSWTITKEGISGRIGSQPSPLASADARLVVPPAGSNETTVSPLREDEPVINGGTSVPDRTVTASEVANPRPDYIIDTGEWTYPPGGDAKGESAQRDGSEQGSQPASPTFTMDIFIVTHLKDVEWLKYCLFSIHQFARGFKHVTVVVPSQEYQQIMDRMKGADWKWLSIKQFDQAPAPLGHLHHNIIKCRADEYTDADYILHLDSDCIFTEPVTPADFMGDGKPVLLIKSWATIEREKTGSICWREPANRALGFQTTHETMQRQPLVYHRGLYPAVRRHVQALHGTPFDKYVLAQKNTYPCGFAEFNTLGSFAIRNLPECYHIIDVGHLPHPHNPVRQYWSHGPMDKPQNIWHEGKLINVTPIDEIKKILAL